ncbi:MAG: GNAT family N-acetyltransferase [Burkholderiales bacterium]
MNITALKSNSFSTDDHTLFRQANDPDTSLNVLAKLSNSQSELIRGAVAYNKSTPEEVIEKLLQDTSAHVLSVLRKRGLKINPRFVKPNKVFGNNLIFRDALIDDASFILRLRTDDKKAQHLSTTANDLSKQIAWLEKYSNDHQQIYFVITNRRGGPVGTVRLYDQQNDSFCWGSWILEDGAPSSYALESALMVYHFAFSLGFNNAHFDVRKGNESVWKFHERFGAVRVEETDLDYFYTISSDAIKKSLLKYQKYLPNGLEIED